VTLTEPFLTIAFALSSTLCVGIMSFATLRGWNNWLALKRAELDAGATRIASENQGGMPSAAARIEVADLKERIRKLEAIAAGVDL
jgi:hypothetical protein